MELDHIDEVIAEEDEDGADPYHYEDRITFNNLKVKEIEYKIEMLEKPRDHMDIAIFSGLNNLFERDLNLTLQTIYKMCQNGDDYVFMLG